MATTTLTADQLSSPIASYEFYNGLCIQHRESHSIRLKSTKARIKQLEDDVKYLKEVEIQRQKISIDWEIRSRIAQAINDCYIGILPKQSYNQLKAAGYGYLPYLLTAWAVDQGEIPMPNDSNEVDEDQLDRYTRKIHSLRARGLIDDVALIWKAVPQTGRNLMINMWVKRDTGSLSNIAHPTPSVEQALSLIRFDQDLTSEELFLAETVIPIAVSKQGNRLFANDGSS